ncbi:MAG: hypothetical protein Q4F99_05395, partial [bacterium]|nr:hypothetical protein [bacterium]
MQKGTFPFSFSITKSKHLDRFVTKLRAIDDDLTNIKIPGRRYDTIEEAVLNMYIKANIHEIPVPIQDVIGALKCKLYAYSAMGEKVAKELLHCSLDAVAIQYPSCENSRILFNDKQPFCRQKFSIFHEIGHLFLLTLKISLKKDRGSKPLKLKLKSTEIDEL